VNPTRFAALSAALLGALLLQSLAATAADACSCLPPDLVRSYNQSDAVLHVRVIRERVRDERVVYRARVVTAYKGCIKPRRRVALVTAADSARCGIKLEPGREYIVTAQQLGRHRRILSIDLCGFNVPFETLTREQHEFLDTRFVCCGDVCRCVNSEPVLCFADPCEVASCPELSECVSNYCGGCNAEFYDKRGQAVCQPCESDDDCAFDQHCSLSGICLSDCGDDGDCGDDAWCSPAYDGGSECRPFQQEGEWCGGFTPIWGQARCAPGLVCEVTDPFIADAPGICRRICADSSGCDFRQYCSPWSSAPIVFGDRENPFGRIDFGWLEAPELSSTEEPIRLANRAVGVYVPYPEIVGITPGLGPLETRICREDGTCRTDRDCNDPNNHYIHPLCVGHGVCVDGLCGWVCGDPFCIDLQTTDLGPCDAVLGWGLVRGACREVSGCDASGLPIFPSRAECEAACLR
jgi:hypothetical protein